MQAEHGDRWIPDIFEASEASSPSHLLETERLVLRPVGLADVDDYADLLADPEVMRYVGLVAGQILAREETEKLVGGATDAWPKNGYGRWSVFERGSDEFVGFSGFRREGDMPELICLLRPKFWGRGFATEASNACLNYGFSTLDFSEVCAYCRPSNGKARRLLERLGGEFIGLTDFHGVEGAAYRIIPKTL